MKGSCPERISRSTTADADASLSPARTTRVVTEVSAQTCNSTHPHPLHPRPENLTATRPEPSIGRGTDALATLHWGDAVQRKGTIRPAGTTSARCRDSLTSPGRISRAVGTALEAAKKTSRRATI
jgi:hypothetical protein